MRQRRQPQFLLSFLDTLCNATAAILILAIIQMHPYRAEGTDAGLFYVTASVQDEVPNGEIEMYVVSTGGLVHSDDSSISREYGFVRRDRVISLITAEALNDDMRVFVYLREPPLTRDEPIHVRVSAHLPGANHESQIELIAAQAFQAEISAEVLR